MTRAIPTELLGTEPNRGRDRLCDFRTLVQGVAQAVRLPGQHGHELLEQFGQAEWCRPVAVEIVAIESGSVEDYELRFAPPLRANHGR